jgi:hypothetical protein
MRRGAVGEGEKGWVGKGGGWEGEGEGVPESREVVLRTCRACEHGVDGVGAEVAELPQASGALYNGRDLRGGGEWLVVVVSGCWWW